MDHRIQNLKRTLEPLKYALEAHRRSLEGLQSALLEFEEALGGQEGQQRPQVQQQSGSSLLSIEDVCQELGMGKSWVYRSIKNGTIPSVKLGHNIKVRREDLEVYLEKQRQQPPFETAS
jgi:excisionase family DNA binding protein